MMSVREYQDVTELSNLHKVGVLEAEDYLALLNTAMDVLHPHSIAGGTETDTAPCNHYLARDYGVHRQSVVEQSHQVLGLRRRHLRLQVTECLEWCDPIDGDTCTK
jgi:hypothetical protein